MGWTKVTGKEMFFMQIVETPYLDKYASENFENDCFIDHEVGKP